MLFRVRTGSETELRFARGAVAALLQADFSEVEVYRRQLDFAAFKRHGTGCAIVVDRTLASPAAFDARIPGAKLPVEGHGHGKLWLLLHGWESYLDDIERPFANHFPDPITLRISLT